jgi:uncharacterized protein
VLVVAVTVVGLARLKVDTGIASFLPADDPALQAMEDRAASFGGDPVVVLVRSPQPRQLFDDEDQLGRLIGLEGRLTHLPDVAEVYGPGTAINQVAISAQNLLAQISGQRDALQGTAEQEARARGADPAAVAAAGQQATAGFDQRYAALLVQALPAGLPTSRNPHFVDSVLFDGNGQPRTQWAAVVPRPDTAAILVRPKADLDQGGTQQLVAAINATVGKAGLASAETTVSGVPAVTAELSHSVQQEFPLLGAVALVVVGGLYFFVGWIARRRARLRPFAAALAGTALTLAVFGWIGRPVSLGVVAFLPILMGIGSDYPLYLTQPTRRRRVLVAAAAGAAGFAALALSPLPFMRELGLALAGGIVATGAVALAMRRWLGVEEPTPTRLTWGTASRAPGWAVRAPALLVAVLIATGGWIALPRLPVEADPETLAQGLPALTQAQHVEDVLGAAGEVSVVLRGPDVLTPAALAWDRSVDDLVDRAYADRLHPITTASSLLAFLGPNPTADQITSGAGLVPPYLASAVIRPDHQVSQQILGIQLQDVAAQRTLLDALRTDLPPPPPGYSADVAGLPVAVSHGYEGISQGRLLINLVAVAAAALVLVLGLRERADAGRAVLTMLLGTGWTMAVTWLISGQLNPLTVAIGALSAATATEFSVVLADAYRRRRPWLLRSAALAASAAVLGYCTLVLSDLAVLRQFGLLLAIGVALSFAAAALVVGVILPPARPTLPADELSSPTKKDVMV